MSNNIAIDFMPTKRHRIGAAKSGMAKQRKSEPVRDRILYGHLR